VAREIRITVDDDEVFERMKYVKADLDLTWEEALKRGLRARDAEGPGAASESRWPSEAPEPPEAPDAPGAGSEWSTSGTSDHGAHDASRSGHGHGDQGSFGDLADQLRDQIRGQVRESLESSMQSVQHDLDREMRDLQAAEDAVLRFDVLEDDPQYEVPLRVRMEISRSGLDVEVVAVREGKSVTGTNRFDRGARRTVNEHLATGGTVTLAFDANGDAETYEVAPVCSWGRHDDRTPRVSSVEIHEVVFDAE
jgi:hypothetical protein